MQGVTLAQLEALAARAPAHRHTAAGGLAIPVGDVFERARAYLAGCPGAVSGTAIDGMKGHDRTVYTAGRLVRGFNLNPDQAYPLFAEWNQKCDPPWNEHHLRRKLEEADKRPGPRGFLLHTTVGRSTASAADSSRKVLRNYFTDEMPDGDTTKKVHRGRPLPAIASDLEDATCGWPLRVGEQLFVLGADGEPLFLKSVEALFAWIGTALAPSDPTAGDPVDWSGRVGVRKSEFFAYLQQNAEHFDSIELSPHEPPLPNVYYVPRPVAGGDGKALADLLRYFNPSTAEDGDLLQAFAMSLLWGGSAGQRPCWLFTAEDGDHGRGVGKSKAVEYIAKLVGECLLVLQCEEFADVVTRLLSPDASGRRVILLDNVKSTRFSWAELEAFITSSRVSGRALYRGEGTKPNYYTVCLTGNKLAVSSDLAGRCVVVKLRRPDYGPGWDAEVIRYVTEHRWQIIGDLVAALRSPTKPVTVRSRWSTWQDEVLARLPDPDAVQRVINERSAAADDDNEEAESIAEAVACFLEARDLIPAKVVVLIPSAVLAEAVRHLFGKGSLGTNQISKIVGTHTIPQLSKSNRGSVRGWLWRGLDSTPGASPTYRITDTGKVDLTSA